MIMNGRFFSVLFTLLFVNISCFASKISVISGDLSIVKNSEIRAKVIFDYSELILEGKPYMEHLKSKGDDFVRDWPNESSASEAYFIKCWNKDNDEGMQISSTDNSEYIMYFHVKKMHMGSGAASMLVGFGAGDALMPAIPSEFISFSFDTSVVGAFLKGFGDLFTNIPNLIMILFSLLFVTFFDTTGTLIPLANQCGFVDEEGNADGIDKAFLGDAISGIIGAILGTSTLTAYVESATGIGLGGRTGLTAVFTGIFFLLALIFAPTVLALFTSSVTAAALVIVGILMIVQLKEVDWDNMVVAASVFMTIIMMLLTYSISLGIAWGFVTYAIASIATGKAKEFSPIMWVMVIIFAIYLLFGL